MARFKTKFCWWPVPLYRHKNHLELEHIGYTWLVNAPLIKNINLGWIHVLGSKPYIYTCPTCKQKVIT